MIDRETKKFVRDEVAKRRPGVITSPEGIAGIARTVALEVIEPIVYKVQTTNATPVNIVVIEIGANECGKIHIEIETVKSDGTAAESIERIVHYRKTGGILDPLDPMWDIFGGDLAVGLTIDDDGSDNIKIEAIGIAATTIDWGCYVKQRKIIATALP